MSPLVCTSKFSYLTDNKLHGTYISKIGKTFGKTLSHYTQKIIYSWAENEEKTLPVVLL